MKAQIVVAVLLAVAVVASAVGTVWVQHTRRTLFVELQGLERARDAMHTEWSQLLLERSTWIHHDRIRRLASRELDMEQPDAGAMVLLTR
ncbi:MAG: cell division protein FtsL [Ectothiorhodospiraceae bacterium]|nr:cell division protein FtsL [Ectothiorhodospiraceae bacterium]